jgi:hypothetical protein
MPSAVLGSNRRRGRRHAMLCSLRYPTSGIVYDGRRLAAVRPASGSRRLVETGARDSAARLQRPSDIQYPISYSIPHQISVDRLQNRRRECAILPQTAGSCGFSASQSCRANYSMKRVEQMSSEIDSCSRDPQVHSNPGLTSFCTPVVWSPISNHRPSALQRSLPGIAMTNAISRSRQLGEARQHGRSMTAIEGPPGGRTAPGVRHRRV